MVEAHFGGWHRAASAELRKAADRGENTAQNMAVIIGHLDAAKGFEEKALLVADYTLQRMLAMGLLMTIEGMRSVVLTGLQTARIR